MHDPILEFGQRLYECSVYLVRIIVQNKNSDSPQGMQACTMHIIRAIVNQPVQNGQLSSGQDTYVQTRPDSFTGQIRLLTTTHKMDTGQE